MVDVETIRMSARQLEKAYHDAAFGGAATAIRVTDPLFLIGTLIAAADVIEALRRGLVEAVIPLEALQLTHSTFNELSPEMRHQIGVSTAVIKALLKGTSDNGQG